MAANPELTKQLMNDSIRAYLDVLTESTETEKPILTKNGAKILEFLQEHCDVKLWKSKDIAEQMGTSSRGVSGTMRKLVSDGFCEKLGQDPIVYSLTEKGKNYQIIKGENEE